jgi:hypothetical protein
MKGSGATLLTHVTISILDPSDLALFAAHSLVDFLSGSDARSDESGTTP